MTTTDNPVKTPLEPLFTLEEVAAALRLDKNNAYTKRQKDSWPHHKIGSKILFTQADFEAIKEIYQQQPSSLPPATRTRRTRR